jgi:hypothetical protein
VVEVLGKLVVEVLGKLVVVVGKQVVEVLDKQAVDKLVEVLDKQAQVLDKLVLDKQAADKLAADKLAESDKQVTVVVDNVVRVAAVEMMDTLEKQIDLAFDFESFFNKNKTLKTCIF